MEFTNKQEPDYKPEAELKDRRARYQQQASDQGCLLHKYQVPMITYGYIGIACFIDTVSLQSDFNSSRIYLESIFVKTMENFEAYLEIATAKGANIVPGAVMAVVDQNGKCLPLENTQITDILIGNFIYKKAAGYNGVDQNAKPLEFDQTFFIASFTKLITAIAALQTVERGLVSLDEPIDKILPELASQPIIESQGSDISLRPAIKAITLRQLITHSSGATYDWVDPKLYHWRALRGETPTLISDGDVAKGYAYPRTFEAGDSWQYSGGFDWASLLVARLNHTSFEEYVEENIAKPLGITTFTWHLPKKPHVEASLMNMSTRQEDGILTDGPTPIWPDPIKEGGGAGLYAGIHDFTRVLSDLLKESPTLLKKETGDQMFTPQFAEGSSALRDLIKNGELAYQCALDFSMENVSPNFGLGSMLLMDDVARENYFKPKGTLTWTGLPNLLWSINRERGMALIFATQVMPWADQKSFDLIARFETAVWQNLSSKATL